MKAARLAEIRAKTEAARPGPWEADADCFDHEKPTIVACVTDKSIGLLVEIDTEIIPDMGDSWARARASQDFADAEFIAMARSAIPELLAEVDRLSKPRRARSRVRPGSPLE
jgi:hypothetical protein